MNTCEQCQYFEKFHGEQTGHCFGAPPIAAPSGNTLSTPQVKCSRRACHVFKEIPAGTKPVEKEKVGYTPVAPEKDGRSLRYKKTT